MTTENEQRFVCIPSIGSTVRLVEDWSFPIYMEGRNHDIMTLLLNAEYSWDSRRYGKPIDLVTLMAGTELKIDRIYIRKNMEEFDSITFIVQSSPDTRFYKITPKKKTVSKKIMKIRFWAKLADVNNSKMVVVHDKSLEGQEAETEEAVSE